MEVHAPSISTALDHTRPFSYPVENVGMCPSVLSKLEIPGSENSLLSGSSECKGVEMPSTPDGNGDSRNGIETSTQLINGQDEVAVLVGSGPGLSSVRRLSEPNAAVKLQKVYRSYRTRRRLADSAVVAEELWWQAIDFARLNHSTISFFDFLKPETAVSRWNRITLNASKVGKGLSKDAKAQKLAFQHWIEAIDPRHRYGHSLHLYYEEWCKADAGQPFFYWLDIGDGKDVDLKKCPRSKLRQQCIKYLGPHEREHYEYIVDEGKIIHKQSGTFLDTKRGPEGTKWIFVMSTTRKLYAGQKKKGAFHHSSFLAGGATIAAGRLEADDGVLKGISAYSGHYRPTDDRLDCLLKFLEDNGVVLKNVEIHRANEDSEGYDDLKPIGGQPKSDSNTQTQLQELDIKGIREVEISSEPAQPYQTGTKTDFKRSLSGGLKSPRADVSEKAILKRINSKKIVNSYQLGHQLSLKWTTGAGPRIGCVADYPVELRVQAMEFVNLSPRMPPTPSSSKRMGGFVGPTAPAPAPGLPMEASNNGDHTSNF